jgi:membrane glycosyltransferase
MDKMSKDGAGAPSVARDAAANPYALLPPQAPLAMPTRGVRQKSVSAAGHDRISGSRAVLLLLTVCATAIFAVVLYQVLSVVRLSVLQAVFLVLCTLCFAWIALGSSSAALGFAAMLGRRKSALRIGAPDAPLPHRTALLFPVYHEDAAGIAATVDAIAEDLIALGHAPSFDIFILSDSRETANKTRELRAVRLLQRRFQTQPRIYYRARAANVGKKAGNIADWVQRFGAGYQSFIILDADSIMSASLIVTLSATLAANPQVALIQTVPRLVGATTLFARLQQFAVACYGPVVAAGFAAWHQGSGNYWGHNAILRTGAFAEAAGLPSLSGAPPLGGHIQSHDFVEAAFLRRAGWEVWMLPDLDGSFEGCPPTLIDSAVRDRRWAQGNLQHLRIVGAKGLPWVSRLHLAMGTYGYFASAFWALSLLVGTVLSIQSAYTLPVYFTDERSLFPVWPVIDATKALYLFLGTIAVVLLPKVFGIIVAVVRKDPAAAGKAHWLLLGFAAETLFSILIAPIFMLTQSKAVADILRGRDSGWSVQRRAGGTEHFTDLLRFHKWHLVVGALAGIVSALASVYVLAWMGPVVLGLLLAAHLSALTSRPPAPWLARALATRETIDPPAIVAKAAQRHPDWTSALATA